MPIAVSCSACGRRLKVRDAALGGRVRCPACGAVFVARAGAGADEEEDRRDRGSPESSDDAYSVQSDPSPAAPTRRRDERAPRRRRFVADADDENDTGAACVPTAGRSS